MDLPEELLIGTAISVGMAVHDNTNQQMINQGIRPNWRRRHPILHRLGWCVVWLGVLGVVLSAGPNLFLDVAQFDVHHGNTGLIDIAVFGSPIWFLGFRAYQRAERRWNVPVGTTRVMDVEPQARSRRDS